MNTWTMTEARAKFCEMVKKAEDGTPQHITLYGKPTVVAMSVEEYKKHFNTLLKFNE